MRNLINDVSIYILSFLTIKELMNIRLINKIFNHYCFENRLWKKICKNHFKKYPFFYNYKRNEENDNLDHLKKHSKNWRI
jgi:hypothetical protein